MYAFRFVPSGLEQSSHGQNPLLASFGGNDGSIVLDAIQYVPAYRTTSPALYPPYPLIQLQEAPHADAQSVNITGSSSSQQSVHSSGIQVPTGAVLKPTV